MSRPEEKSTVDEIRERFDNDVERFSILETGQAATVDAPLAMELLTEAASLVSPGAADLLDIGCGAGNYTIKQLDALPDLNVTLVDLSRPMLDRAEKRIRPLTNGQIHTLQGDVREIDFGVQQHDIILAAAVLHHLRNDQEWHDVFAKFFRTLRPGGSVWIFDLVQADLPAVQTLQWQRYGDYLTQLRDESYRDHVFAYIAKEDTPRSLNYQMQLLRDVGFSQVEVVHKHLCFAAFGAAKQWRQAVALKSSAGFDTEYCHVHRFARGIRIDHTRIDLLSLGRRAE